MRRNYKQLIIYPVLKKWLYLPEPKEDLEEAVRVLVEAILADAPRTGVEPKANPPKGGRKDER